MLLTVSTSHQPATDLGYLLHKNPSRLQSFELSFGRAHVFYPEASAERCTAALLLEVDPVRLVRGGKGKDAEGFGLDQYVNDRPYVASSFLSVAIGEVFGTALSGRSKDRPQLVNEKLPLEASVAVVASRGGQDLLQRLFEPLGYDVSASGQPLDPVFPDWGESCYYHLTLKGTCRLRDLLTHLSVLIPVLDNEKHYFVGDDEVEKLLRRGQGWLETHPEKALISTRYLKYRRSLIRAALDRLTEPERPEPDAAEEAHAAEEEAIEKPIRLHDQRLNAVLLALKDAGAARVVDLGCGSGRLLGMLLKDNAFKEIVGLDVSFRSLERARDNLRLDRLPERRRERISLIHGSLTYRDCRLEGYDAAVAVEVVEHLDPFRVDMFNRVVFEFARPALVILTTPNREYNDLFPSLPAGRLRHRDHRFEWTRDEFAAWAADVAGAHGYDVTIQGIGLKDPDRGISVPDGNLQVKGPGMNIAIPELALVVLIGPSGSGKSTFASAHFLPTETLSSDGSRALVSDDYNNQEATRDAFDILHAIASKRLERGRLTVIDATNVQKEARAPLIALARKYHCLPVAIVFDLPERICQARNAARPDRSFGPHVVRRHRADMRRSLKGLAREGFRHVFVLTSEAEVNAVKLSRVPLWNDRKSEHGPCDIIGDVHGCGDELEQLLAVLGYVAPSSVEVYGGSIPLYSHPYGRKAVFLGDLNDRGPRILDTMRIVKAMVDSGSGICVPGNHDVKLMRKLRGRNVQITHGLDVTLADIQKVPAGVRAAVEKEIADFIDGLVSHFVFDDGKLVVAHAGMIESMQGRGSGGVREFALYGETTGETDEFGLPVRYNWAADYRGRARVVYGHTPVPTPEWLNGTINIDTGCVFGGALTALRYPEDELVRVEAHAVYADPVRPFVRQPPSEADFSAQQQHDSALDVSDVLGKRLVETRLAGNVTVREENATAALEVMSRFAVDPRWLVYLPPTMSPSESSSRPDVLEHPDEAFTYYAKEGVRRVVCEEKHMGSRAVIVVCRDEETARRRFGVEGCGMIYTRTGRPMFEDRELSEQLLSRARTATSAAGLWDELNTDWLVLDCELMPWSAKAQGLLKNQYAAVGAAARAALTQTIESLEAASARLPDAAALLETARERQTMTEKYVEAYRHYCWTVSSINDYKIAPFHLLASEGKVHVDRSHAWHMDTLARLARNDEDLFLATPYRIVDLESHESFPKRLAQVAAANRASDRQVRASTPDGNDAELGAALDAATELHPGSQTNAESELHPGSQTNGEAELHPGSRTNAEPNLRHGSQTTAATNLRPGSQTNAESDLHRGSQTNAEPELHPGSRTTAESELHPGQQTNAEPELRLGSQTNAEPELHPGTQTDAEPDLRHGSQTNSEPYIHAPGSRPRDSFTLSASEGAVISESEAATTIMADQDLRGAITPEAATEWWSELTNRGGEGMVVKPLEFLAQGRRGVVQPALKCRGPEYLRIIYGPEYLEPANLDRLRKRSVRVKRSLAFREFALGLEALERFVLKEPLRRIHECVFAVLALESEPVDPRL